MEPFEDENNAEKQAEKINGLSIAGMVVGISSILINIIGLLGITAIVLSSIALSQINARGGKGKGFAIAGLVLGIIGTVWGAIQCMIVIYSLSLIPSIF